MNKILMYHSIGNEGVTEAEGELYAVTLENFRKQMEHIAGSVPCGDRPCLTFDDGDITNYKYTLPVLKEFGLKAYFFIIAPRVGRSGYMSWEQIKALKEAGMIIGSHGMTHTFLTELKDKQLDYEIRGFQKYLEEKLGFAIEYFSIPRGFHNNKIIKKIKDTGYKAVFTSNPKDNDGFKFGRLAVRSDWDINYFTRVIEKGEPVRKRVADSIKSSIRKTIGLKNYEKARQKLVKRKKE